MIFTSPLALNGFYFSSKPLLRKLGSYKIFFKERNKHYFPCSLKVLCESEKKTEEGIHLANEAGLCHSVRLKSENKLGFKHENRETIVVQTERNLVVAVTTCTTSVQDQVGENPIGWGSTSGDFAATWETLQVSGR